MKNAQSEPLPDAGIDVAGLPGGARAALEAVLMVLDQPASATDLAAGLNLTVDVVEQLLLELQREYDGYTVKAPDMEIASEAGFTSSPRGFELRNVAGGWRIYSRVEFAEIVGAFVLEGQTARLTQAALETLAVIAYRQPVGRAEIEEIRGVNIGSTLKLLVERGLIEITGRAEGLGRPMLYGTTNAFLEHFALRHLEELPHADELAIALRSDSKTT